MVAGMTPCTANNDFVAAFSNAGFHGELGMKVVASMSVVLNASASAAGGGQPRKNIFYECVNELVGKLKPGLGVSINCLYLNPKQWGFQYPAILDMLDNGIPIDHVTIAAGVPSTEKAVEILSAFLQRGLSQVLRILCFRTGVVIEYVQVSFKPGNADAILRVIDIAEAVPRMNVVLQWTGGRAGGHHSFEVRQRRREFVASLRSYFPCAGRS